MKDIYEVARRVVHAYEHPATDGDLFGPMQELKEQVRLWDTLDIPLFLRREKPKVEEAEPTLEGLEDIA